MRSARSIFASLDHPAWIRFFVGLAGLVLAFAAALFSTVFREQGSPLGTAIAASVALLTAGFVGLYTVPYLAKRAALERFRDAMDYDVTREGAIYLGVALVIAVAALNTNNNLLFIVVSAMIAAILVSGIASFVALRGLRLELVLPSRVFARQVAMARINLRNSLPIAVFSISVDPPQAHREQRFVWEPGVFAWPPNRPPERQWVRWPDLKLRSVEKRIAADAILREPVYFPFLVSKDLAHADVELLFPRRGLYAQDQFGVATRFPFSFLKKTRRIGLQREVIVFPSVEPTDEFFEVLPMITGEFEAMVAGRGHDLYRIREHQPGDSARLVDWKATAKSGGLKVREFTREDERKLRIVFDNPPPGRLPESAYEAAVELAASLAWHFHEQDTQLAFAAPGYAGSADIFAFLRHLALAQPAAAPSILSALPLTQDYNIVLTAQPRGSLPTSLWASAYIIFMDRTHRR